MAENRLPAGSREKPLILFGHDVGVARWAANELGIEGFGACTALGVVLEDNLIAGVVYHNYRDTNIEMSIATLSPRWASRNTLFCIFAYPFNQLGVKRVTCLIDTLNESCINLVERLGFTHEGTLREAHPNGDAEIYGMLKAECRWLKNEQKIQT